MLQKDKFSFANGDDVELDGPTMLYLIFTKIDPSTSVGLDSIVEDLENAKLGDHQNDVDKMLTVMESNIKILKDNDAAPRNIRKLLINALKTGPNHDFNRFIERIEDDVDSGIGQHSTITAEDLIIAARTKYNNMCKKNTWNKVDPRDAQLMALVTEVNELRTNKKGLLTPAVLATTTPSASDPERKLVPGTKVEVWRTKYDGQEKKFDGRKYHWCRHHRLEGKWDGLYTAHPESKHKGKKLTNLTSISANEPASNPTSETSQQAALQLNSRLKQVLCTNLCLSQEDVDKIFEEANASGN